MSLKRVSCGKKKNESVLSSFESLEDRNHFLLSGPSADLYMMTMMKTVKTSFCKQCFAISAVPAVKIINSNQFKCQ